MCSSLDFISNIVVEPAPHAKADEVVGRFEEAGQGA